MNSPNLPNRTIFCHDNLEVLQGINSECIDLIYLDPPFNKDKQFTAPVGSNAEGASFRDIFREKDIKDEWVESIRYENAELYAYLAGVKTFSNKYNYCYLVYMAIRLLECHRVLKSTGSTYLHCDPTMSHHLKIVLDCIFGESNFRNEIVWFYPDTPGRPKKDFPRKHDIVLRYTKTERFVFNGEEIKVPIKEESKERYKYARVLGGRSKVGGDVSGKVPEDVWRIASVKHNSKQSTNYPTQKPLALLERIISASSNEGDIVLDPFCGCATTCVAAEKLGRKWIGIDVSEKAHGLVKQRLRLNGIHKKLHEPDIGDYDELVHFKTSPPKRTDTNGHIPEGNVYIISNPQWQGRYKVGIAKNIKSRLNSYQTSDPDRAYKVELEHRSPHYKEIEKHIHSTFDSEHEWVSGELEELQDAIVNYKPEP